MNKPDTRLEGIADITAPLVPPETGIDPVLAATLACILLAAIAIIFSWRLRRTPRARARRQLAELHAEYRHMQLDNRTASFRLAAILRSGLQLAAISHTTHLPSPLASRQHRWQTFVTQLQQARYTRTACDNAQLEALFMHARYWLKHWS